MPVKSSNSTSPNANVIRTELNDQGAQQVARSAGFWFEDGNMILQAENTQFRVHRGVIERHSQVFRDMFSLPQPETETLINECPLIYVSDASKDWENFLGIFYDYNSSYISTDEFNFPLLSAMLRLGKKYQFNGLQEMALGRIRVELPDSLDLWDKMFPDGVHDGAVAKSDCEIALINLLEETGYQTLLPMAFFFCMSSLNPVAIFRGLRSKSDGIMHRLSAESIEKLILARDDISQATVDYELGWAKTPSSIPTAKCLTRPQCETHRSKVFENRCPDTKPGWALTRPDWKVYCSNCTSDIRRIYFVGRQHIWDNLPTYFGLPEWKNLKDF